MRGSAGSRDQGRSRQAHIMSLGGRGAVSRPIAEGCPGGARSQGATGRSGARSRQAKRSTRRWRIRAVLMRTTSPSFYLEAQDRASRLPALRTAKPISLGPFCLRCRGWSHRSHGGAHWLSLLGRSSSSCCSAHRVTHSPFCARAGGVAWRVARSEPLNPLGPSGN